MRTNVNAGLNLPSVAPAINGLDFDDPIENTLAPGETTGIALLHDSLSVNQVRWSTFTLTNCVDFSGGYVDIDFSARSDSVADAVAWIFDSNGNIVAFSDDVGGSNKPQFSFGLSSPARPAPAGSSQPCA